jgi:hypothetical protein
MLAVVRLLAGVCAGVDSQGTPLDEALAAVRVVALVRALVCVYPIMPLQIRLAVEALWVASATSSSPPPPKSPLRMCTHLATTVPVALEGARRGGFVVNNLHDFHFWRLLGSWFRR